MTARKRFNVRKILCLVLMLLLGGELILSAFSFKASAATSTYSDVLDDLEKDDSFDSDEYPAISDDHSLTVIQIAEGENGELFVYVYYPGKIKEILASSINISTAIRDQAKFKNYTLSLINCNGVFYKYKILGISVSSDAIRYYEISSIFRPWYDEIDEFSDNANTISEVAYPVAKQYMFNTLENTEIVEVSDIEYIEIQDKFVGYGRYVNYSIGFGMIQEDCDAHFVAFSTQRDIEELLEADVFYSVQTYYYKLTGSKVVYEYWSDIQEQYSYLNYEDKAIATYGNTFIKNEAIWDRIQKTDDFLSSDFEDGLFMFSGFDNSTDVTFTDEAFENLNHTDWVLFFVETDYYINTSYESLIKQYSRVGDVSVLRLKFRTNDKVYNLGVIDNKQSGSEFPSYQVESEDMLVIILKVLFAILLVLIFIALLSPLVGIVKILYFGIKFLLWLLWRFLTCPFYLLGMILKKHK